MLYPTGKLPSVKSFNYLFWFLQVPNNSLQTASIHKCKDLANYFQYNNANQKLANFFNSQVPKTCEPMSIHKCKTKANKQLQFTNVKTLQTVATSQMPNQSLPMQNQSLQTALIHKCQELVSWYQLTNAKQKLANSFNLQVPRHYKLLSINMCPTKACQCQS